MMRSGGILVKLHTCIAMALITSSIYLNTRFIKFLVRTGLCFNFAACYFISFVYLANVSVWCNHGGIMLILHSSVIFWVWKRAVYGIHEKML